MPRVPEPPQQLTEQLTVKKALRVVGAGICLVVAAVLLYLGSTIPGLKQYAYYAAVYILGTTTFILMVVFLVGCCWCILRLVAPKQAGSSISEWSSKVHASLYPSNGQLGRAGRTQYVLYCIG
ncbi:hypothetical protein DFH29DRAFT_923279 [Suillus ampliporus]|nr:hypothetical protein DFH29DRAFT_923279 [Suillus ampliporus]